MLHVYDGHIFALGCSKSPFFLLHSNVDKPYAKQKLMKTALEQNVVTTKAVALATGSYAIDTIAVFSCLHLHTQMADIALKSSNDYKEIMDIIK